jgi:FkbH-like protein
VQVDAKCRALQQFALAQRDAGMVLCLCSKNNEEDVWRVFEQNPGMLLKREHIVASRINWQPKSENLRGLSRDLQLGLDSFVFLDDSGLECSEVEARCPEVLALRVPESEAELSHLLSHVWAFDHLKITAEDRKRSDLYAQEVRREQVRKQSQTLDDFLAGLELTIDIAPMEKADVARVAQLTQRTNQFNFTTVRCSESEVENVRQGGNSGWLTVRVKDRFGDYGLVGALLYTRGPKFIEVENVLLSCRALGRHVEHRMLSYLDGLAQEQSFAYARIRFIPSAKNKPAREFLESLGATFDKPEGSSYSLAFPAGRITELCAAAPVKLPADGGQEPADTPVSQVPTGKMGSRVLQRIAQDLDEPGKIAQAIEAKNPVRRRGDDLYVPARTPLEESLALLWAKELKMDKVGANDNFFALGGHSLLAMRIVAEIRDKFNVGFSLEAFFQAPVLGAQSQRVEEMLLEEANDGDLERLIAEMEEQPEAGGKPRAASAAEKSHFRGIA